MSASLRRKFWPNRARCCLFFKPTIEDVAPGVDHGNSDKRLPEDLQRQAVFYRSHHPTGTIVIETSERHLYLIESETRALRYGIGVGRDGFTWAGLLQITRQGRVAGLASAT